MTYIIEALPGTKTIEITGSPLSPFLRMDGAELHNDVVVMPFNQQNAKTLFTFLRGEDFQMKAQTKTYLRLMLDHGEDALKGKEWSVNLHTLRNQSWEHRAKNGRGLQTNWDLLHYLPLRYIDKSNPQHISELEIGSWGVVIGVITKAQWENFMNATVIEVRDVNNDRISATFFRQMWLTKQFREGDEVVLSGTFSEYVNKRTGKVTPQLTNAAIERIQTYDNGHKIAPVYSEKGGVKKAKVFKDLDIMLDNIAWIEDPVPEPILEKYELMTRNEAYRKLHFPDTLEEAEEARRRIAFDDFVRLQVFLLNSKQNQTDKRQGVMHTKHNLSQKFVDSLPFTLTGAQQRVSAEIAEDMALAKPMLRLLHGEVSSGKTEVSTIAILNAVESKTQVAFLAPTTILAEQLYERFVRDMKRAHITSKQVRPALFHNGVKLSERKKMLEQLADGEINVLIGTHSILSKNVIFQNLGFIVIDEQHRFGAKHRTTLQENYTLSSEVTPDVLMMSATPIPRTMAQTIYGDMEVSVIDELPGERKPVFTYWEEDESEVWTAIREQVNEGHQAYVIAALVEESESERLEDVENATSTQAFLQTSIFPEFKVGLVHGKMKASEKAEVLAAFYRNEINILVSTSVVEVGVNVPNATVMTVLNANRFGIASLHQIRGRVGRGEFQSYCYLVSAAETTSPDGEERLNALVASNDGFWLAERDLEIRGEGSLFTTAQSGKNDMIVGNLREHRKLLDVARRVAPSAAKSPRLQLEVREMFGDANISS